MYAIRSYYEQGAGSEFELPLLVPVDIGTDQVGGEQVRGELDTMEVALDGLRQGLDGGGLGQSGQAFDEEMAVAQEADQHTVDKTGLADDPGGEMGTQRRNNFV